MLKIKNGQQAISTVLKLYKPSQKKVRKYFLIIFIYRFLGKIVKQLSVVFNCPDTFLGTSCFPGLRLLPTSNISVSGVRSSVIGVLQWQFPRNWFFQDDLSLENKVSWETRTKARKRAVRFRRLQSSYDVQHRLRVVVWFLAPREIKNYFELAPK